MKVPRTSLAVLICFFSSLSEPLLPQAFAASPSDLGTAAQRQVDAMQTGIGLAKCVVERAAATKEGNELDRQNHRNIGFAGFFLTACGGTFAVHLGLLARKAFADGDGATGIILTGVIFLTGGMLAFFNRKFRKALKQAGDAIGERSRIPAIENLKVTKLIEPDLSWYVYSSLNHFLNQIDPVLRASLRGHMTAEEIKNLMDAPIHPHLELETQRLRLQTLMEKLANFLNSPVITQGWLRGSFKSEFRTWFEALEVQVAAVLALQNSMNQSLALAEEPDSKSGSDCAKEIMAHLATLRLLSVFEGPSSDNVDKPTP